MCSIWFASHINILLQFLQERSHQEPAYIACLNCRLVMNPVRSRLRVLISSHVHGQFWTPFSNWCCGLEVWSMFQHIVCWDLHWICGMVSRCVHAWLPLTFRSCYKLNLFLLCMIYTWAWPQVRGAYMASSSAWGLHGLHNLWCATSLASPCWLNWFKLFNFAHFASPNLLCWAWMTTWTAEHVAASAQKLSKKWDFLSSLESATCRNIVGSN